MERNKEMEVHYMNTGYPCNGSEGFMDFFGGLSQAPLHFAQPPPIPQDHIVFRNPCLEGKKLLVLDIDYTLFDHRSPTENPVELMRPSTYAEYDIIIWSATKTFFLIMKIPYKQGATGYMDLPDVFKFGFIMALVNALIWAVVGCFWWKFLGLY